MHGISNNVVCATSKASDQPAHTRSLIRVLASRLSIIFYDFKLLTDHHLEEASHVRLSLHLSKCHIVGNHMPQLNLFRFGPVAGPQSNA